MGNRRFSDGPGLWTAMLAAAVAVAYFATGRLGLLLAIPPGVATPVWIASGVALAAVMLWGPRVWPGIWIGSAAVNFGMLLDAGDPAAFTIAAAVVAVVATGSTLQALVAAHLLRRVTGAAHPFTSVRDVMLFIAVAVIACCIAATLGTTSLALASLMPWEHYAATWFTWWLGDVVGILIITPIPWARAVSPQRLNRLPRAIEMILFLLAVFIAGQLVFQLPGLYTSEYRLLPYLLLPLLIWGAVRFGQRGVMLASVVIGSVAIAATLAGRGPFARTELHDGLLLLQTYIGILVTTGLILAAAVAERRRALEQLRQLNQTLELQVTQRTAEAQQRAEQLHAITSELIHSEQRERRRLAHVLHDQLQQSLVAARMQIRMLQKRDSDATLTRGLQRIDQLISESLVQSRTLTSELAPPVLKNEGLAPAFQWLAGWMRQKHALTVAVDADDIPIPQQETAICLFDAARELLFNVVKHAGVSRACLTLRCVADTVRVTVEDAGRGFDPASHMAAASDGVSFGLFAIRERFGLIGGRIELDSAPGRGTCVTLIVPTECPAPRGSEAASGLDSDAPEIVITAAAGTDATKPQE